MIVGRIKPPKISEIDQEACLCEVTLYQKVEIFDILGRNPTPCADWGEILHSQVDPCARQPC